MSAKFVLHLDDEEAFVKPKGARRVLALDQSTKVTGFAIFQNDIPIKYGIFEALDGEEIARDINVKIWMLNIIKNWDIDLVALEGIQLQNNDSGRSMGVTVFQTLARLQGILMGACQELGMPYMVCPTNTWRNHCGVKGKYRADKKRSMQLLTKQWYDITVRDDIADAIGIGKYASERSQTFGDIPF